MSGYAGALDTWLWPTIAMIKKMEVEIARIMNCLLRKWRLKFIEKGQICAMRKSKVFLGLAILFVVAMAVASYDISRKTTFPGSKSQLKERIKKKYTKADTVRQTQKKWTSTPVSSTLSFFAGF